MSANSLPSYDAPPVVEVVLGLTFEPLSRVKLPHVGLFWDSIRSDFPLCQQAPPLGNLDSIIEPESGVPLPRVWLISRADDSLIQLQKNKFLFNWRKRESAYPRFGTVSEKFYEYLDVFKRFLAKNELGAINASECELTYINHILKGTEWESAKDIGSVLPDINWQQTSGRFLPDPDALNWSAVFTMPGSAGKLVAKMNSATRMPDNVPLLLLDLTAKGTVENKSDEEIKVWYETAREWIVRGFEDLTSENVQRKHWRRI